MNIEVKFRAWDKTLNKMFGVDSLEFSQWWVQCKRPIDAPKHNGNAFYGERNSFKNKETDRHILMQFTGLKDKNDKEIYEGDILHRDGYWDVYVVWDDKKACFACLCTDWVVSQGKPIILSNFDLSQYEIITNIYKNPELLTH